MAGWLGAARGLQVCRCVFEEEEEVGAESAEEIMNNWPWDDINEEKYM